MKTKKTSSSAPVLHEKGARQPLTRSEMMGRVRSKNTGPEKIARSLLHALGYRFRLHRRDLPGSPDIVFSARKVAIFVHGCFWHGHGCKRAGHLPKTNVDFWAKKLADNLARDARNRRALEALGWKVLTIWECELKDCDALAVYLLAQLGCYKMVSGHAPVP